MKPKDIKKYYEKNQEMMDNFVEDNTQSDIKIKYNWLVLSIIFFIISFLFLLKSLLSLDSSIQIKTYDFPIAVFTIAVSIVCWICFMKALKGIKSNDGKIFDMKIKGTIREVFRLSAFFMIVYIIILTIYIILISLT